MNGLEGFTSHESRFTNHELLPRGEKAPGLSGGCKPGAWGIKQRQGRSKLDFFLPLGRRPDNQTAKLMQFLVRENQTSVRLSGFHASYPGHLANLAHLLWRQTEQVGCSALVNNFFPNRLAQQCHHVFFRGSIPPRLVHNDAGPVVLLYSQDHWLININIPGVSYANPNGLFRFPHDGSSQRHSQVSGRDLEDNRLSDPRCVNAWHGHSPSDQLSSALTVAILDFTTVIHNGTEASKS